MKSDAKSESESESEPCGNDDCDKCDPRPRWKISQHRVQHLTYTREIKAADLNVALLIFESGTSWPSQYDDSHGEVVQLDPPVIERLPPDEYYLTECCFHKISVSSVLGEEGAPSIQKTDGKPQDVRPEAVGSLLDEIQGAIGAEHLSLTVDRLETALARLLEKMPEFEGGGPLVEQLGEEMAFLRISAREAALQAGVPWASKVEQERLLGWIRGRRGCR